MRFWRLSFVVVAVCSLFAEIAVAGTQYGELLVNAHPEQAYVFVDGMAIHEASYGPIKLAVGDHKVDIYNYGFKPESRNVTIQHWHTTTIDVTLDPIPGTLSGPWGCVTIEGAARDAVLLNGKTPEYFVGHGDEFNHEWGPKQELVLSPGTYQLTILRRGNVRWTGAVSIEANKRTVIDIPKGIRKTVPWPRGSELKNMPRFTVGIASAEVVVARPTAQLSASASDLECGGSEKLSWTTSDAGHVEISNIGVVPLSGEQQVQPNQTTDYVITASGPGGTATSDVNVKVGGPIQASLGASPTEVHYKQVGDKVVTQESSTLTWAVNNANVVAIDPLGSVDVNGTRSVQITPHKTSVGPVDETITYTLTATNKCGTSQTQTASVHVTGSIDPAKVAAPAQLEKRLALHSIYFATAQPVPANPNGGLIASQEKTLLGMAIDFKEYLTYQPDANLILEGHADQRGSAEYNQALSERRVGSAKHFLVEHGIPEDHIKIVASGFQKNLTATQVKDQIDQDPDLTPPDKAKIDRNLQTIVLANNRRVDATLSTTGDQSARVYPFNASDALNLIGGPVRTPAPKKPAATHKTGPARRPSANAKKKGTH